ncbi:MAG TPA: hypothetical protein VKE69_08255 [Planctomycetota bacterium]|nr:hypothetical protein [Planctomycetota bacterium]
MRRALAAALVALYALVATGAFPGGLDLVAESWKFVAAGAFACADHACGCASAKECRERCCCGPHAEAPRAPRTGEPARVRVLLASSAKCRGDAPGDGVLAAGGLAPHVPASAALPLALEAPREPRIEGEEESPREGARRDVEKVPLAIG